MKNIKENYLFFIMILLFIIIFTVYLLMISKKTDAVDDNYLRIATLSPIATEYIYDIGLEKYLIANTIYCNFPENAKNKEKIGSFNDTNYEQIAKLKINTAIIQSHMQKQKEKLASMGIKTIEINNTTINDILNSYDILGKVFNLKNITDNKKNQIILNIKKLKNSLHNKNKNYSAIISIFRNYGYEITSITAAGGNNVYNDILEILQINNPLKSYPAYSNISKESILETNPDFIFDMYHGEKINNIINDWKNMPLNAVKNNDIIILNESYISLPGPRINLIIEKFVSEYLNKINDKD